MDELTGKKILIVVTKSNWGGAQWYVYTLATHFKEAGANVVVALGGTGDVNAPTGRLHDLLTEARVRTIVLSSFTRDIHVLREFRALAELVHIIREERPDILHLNSSKAGGLGALAGRLCGIRRIIFTSHGLAYDEDRPLYQKGVIWLATWATFLLSHAVILLSRATYERARTLPFCYTRMHLIYNGIVPPPLIDRAVARAKLLPDRAHTDTVWIGTIAEYTRNKGLSYLLNAAARMKNDGSKFILCLIGTEGDERTFLEKIIADESLGDCVFLLGFIPHAATYLSAFDIFALTSVKEGLPTVLLEAAEARCAVVASGIPGVTDILDSETGILVRPRSAQEIAYEIQSLIHDPTRRKRLGDALHDKARSSFSMHHMIDQTLSLYCPPSSS